jgi:3-oxoacyl-[acyl-carrier-protein] synthase III
MTLQPREQVGLAGLGVYLPAQVETSSGIARKTGIPVEIVEEKMGLRQKHIAAPDEHVSDMALAASRAALQGFNPAELDAVIYFGSQYKDFPVWSCACKLQYELGAHRAFATEIMSLCASFTVALRMVKGMMLAEDGLNNVLLAVASKESYLIDYTNPRVRFMYNFGDGGAAVLLRKGLAKNVILETHNITAGFFNKHVKVLEGGSANPLTGGGTLPAKAGLLEVLDPEEMKEHLDPITFTNFITVVKTALARSGKTMAELDFLAPIHFKRSLHRQILQELGLDQDSSFYLENYGHVQAADQIIVLWEASQKGLLKDGAIIALLAAGTGYTWGSTILRWGQV